MNLISKDVLFRRMNTLPISYCVRLIIRFANNGLMAGSIYKKARCICCDFRYIKMLNKQIRRSLVYWKFSTFQWFITRCKSRYYTGCFSLRESPRFSTEIASMLYEKRVVSHRGINWIFIRYNNLHKHENRNNYQLLWKQKMK